MPTPNEFFLTDYGGDPTGASYSDSAITAALAAMTSAGGILRVPAGTYKFHNPIVLDRSMTVLGDGDGSSRFVTDQATGDIVTVSGPGGGPASTIMIRGLYIGVKSGTTRSVNAVSVNITSACSKFRMAECVIDEAATAVLNNCLGFAYFDDCVMTIEPLSGSGVGITSSGPNGLYVRRCFLAGVGLTVNSQPFMGIDLSQTGNAFIEATQCLVTGYGLYAAPGMSQICTSIWITDTFCDNCRVGAHFAPASSTDGVVSTIKMTGLWACSATYYGLNLDGGASGGGHTPLLANVIISQLVATSDGYTNGYSNLRIANAHDITVEGGIIASNPLGADVEISGSSNGVILSHNQIGFASFPSNYGVLVQNTADRVIVSENLVAPHTISSYVNSSSGATILHINNV